MNTIKTPSLLISGLIPYNIALQLLSYLRKETEYVPWKAGLRNLKYVKKMLETTKDYGIFKVFSAVAFPYKKEGADMGV